MLARTRGRRGLVANVVMALPLLLIARQCRGLFIIRRSLRTRDVSIHFGQTLRRQRKKVLVAQFSTQPTSEPPKASTDDGTHRSLSADSDQGIVPAEGRFNDLAVTSLLAADVATIEVVPTVEDEDASTEPSTPKPPVSSKDFVKMFRGSATYIAAHQKKTVVYHLPGELLEWDGFESLMDDIALTWLLGMKPVIVAGCRHQINSRLGFSGHTILDTHAPNYVRVTDTETLRVAKEEAGYVRFEVERQLARSLRLQSGFGPSGSLGKVGGNVVSGNFFSARPVGVIDGVDFGYSGYPRRIEVDKIRHIHSVNDIVLLTPLGISPSGEVFNVNSETLAARVAGALDASKVIFFTTVATAFRNRANGNLVQNLRLPDARRLLEHNQIKIDSKGFASLGWIKDESNEGTHMPSSDGSFASVEALLKVAWAVSALQLGVKRAHIIAPTDGSLLQELYTRDGSGTLISRDLYEGIRQAKVEDVSCIFDLINPLVEAGILVARSKSTLERDISTFHVYTRDSLVVACGQLKRFEGNYAEIACLVVSQDYRNEGRGDAMLGYFERLCHQSGSSNVFVLSTQTMEWFVERGFREVNVNHLPPSRRDQYNHSRRSKIYMKHITGDRDLDAAELFWDR